MCVGQRRCTARRGPARAAVALSLVVAHLAGRRRQAGARAPGPAQAPQSRAWPQACCPGAARRAVPGCTPLSPGGASRAVPASFASRPGWRGFPSHRHVSGSRAHSALVRSEQPSRRVRQHRSLWASALCPPGLVLSPACKSPAAHRPTHPVAAALRGAVPGSVHVEVLAKSFPADLGGRRALRRLAPPRPPHPSRPSRPEHRQRTGPPCSRGHTQQDTGRGSGLGPPTPLGPTPLLTASSCGSFAWDPGVRQAGCLGAHVPLVAASGARGPLTCSLPHLVPSSTGSYPDPLSRTSAWQGAESVVTEQEPRSRGFWPPSQSRTPHLLTLWTEGPAVVPADRARGTQGVARRRGHRPWDEPWHPPGGEPGAAGPVVQEGGGCRDPGRGPWLR